MAEESSRCGSAPVPRAAHCGAIVSHAFAGCKELSRECEQEVTLMYCYRNWDVQGGRGQQEEWVRPGAARSPLWGHSLTCVRKVLRPDY